VVRQVYDKEHGVFRLAGGVLDWFVELQVKQFFSLLADNLPGAEIVLTLHRYPHEVRPFNGALALFFYKKSASQSNQSNRCKKFKNVTQIVVRESTGRDVRSVDQDTRTSHTRSKMINNACRYKRFPLVFCVPSAPTASYPAMNEHTRTKKCRIKIVNNVANTTRDTSGGKGPRDGRKKGLTDVQPPLQLR
jgi:hypothetical protein